MTKAILSPYANERIFLFSMKGWWSGGFGYGLWIGILVALGFSVVPVPSFSWKKKFELSGSTFTKVWLVLRHI